jgi:alpha-ketoglutarate-dependent taurine dioxygenase
MTFTTVPLSEPIGVEIRGLDVSVPLADDDRDRLRGLFADRHLDNLVLQHGRRANPNAVRRSMRRVAIHDIPTNRLVAGTGFDPEWRRRHATA